MANEKRLIDGNGRYTLNASDNTEHSLCFGGGIISVMDECGHCICEFDAEDAPTVDAVEVVRCKVCKHSEPCGESRQCLHPFGLNACDGNDFCSYGERRNDG